MPNADQQKVLAVLSARYQQLRVTLRTLLPDGVYDDDAEPLDASTLTDVEMIGEEMRQNCLMSGERWSVELYKRIWFYGEFGKLLFRSTKCGRR